VDFPLRVSIHTFFSIQYQAKQGRVELSTAAVERGPSQAARSGSKESSARPCTTPFVPHS
jgi:hypothetical protein